MKVSLSCSRLARSRSPVFSGLYRFGYHSAAAVLGATPDISVYAKILTGGLLPLSATLASRSIFDAFLSDRKVDALLHGHSYTANPVGCAVALKALQMIEGAERDETWAGPRADWDAERWSFWQKGFLDEVSRAPGVKGAMAMGTVLAVELQDSEADYASHVAQGFLDRLRAQRIDNPPFRIHSRPLGNVVYIMTSLFTPGETVRAMEAAILRELK